MGKCRKASKRRRRPECPYCEHYVRRGIEQHLKRCPVKNDPYLMKFYGKA